MHSFWTLLKADFLAETLSKVLFSGKYPKLVAFIILFFVGIYLCLRHLLRLTTWMGHLPFKTQWVRAFRSIKQTASVAKKLGDKVSPAGGNSDYFELVITGSNWAQQIHTIRYRINKRTGLLNIVFLRQNTEFQAHYAFLIQHAGLEPGFEMIADSLPRIHQKIRTNLL